MWASRLGHVGAAAAAPACEGGNFLDDLPGMVTFRKVGGYQAQQHGLAVAFTAQKNDARAEPVPELVAQYECFITKFLDGYYLSIRKYSVNPSRGTQYLPEGRGERIEPDGLLRGRSRVVDIQFSASLGLPYIGPIGKLDPVQIKGFEERYDNNP